MHRINIFRRLFHITVHFLNREMKYLPWNSFRQAFTSRYWRIWQYRRFHPRHSFIIISNISAHHFREILQSIKFRLIPKRKSQQLFSGTIYIIEDLWCLHSVDLINENIAGKIRIQQLYIPVQDDIWMPVSHKFEINISIIGFKADAGYGSSIKYIDVKLKQTLQKPRHYRYRLYWKSNPSGLKLRQILPNQKQNIR